MEKKDTLSKILAILGMMLVWIPILAPVVLGFGSLAKDGIFRFDFLMPAELGMFIFIGGILLLLAAIRRRARRAIIAWGLGIAIVSMAVLTAFGDAAPGTLRMAIAVGLLIAYSLAVVGLGIGGVLLCRDLFRK
jgi:hypothetical protein